MDAKAVGLTTTTGWTSLIHSSSNISISLNTVLMARNKLSYKRGKVAVQSKVVVGGGVRVTTKEVQATLPIINNNNNYYTNTNTDI